MTYIVHLENIDQFLSKAHIANSDQDKRIEPYYSFKDSTHISIASSFLLLEIFLENFNEGQYGLIHIFHLVKSHKVRSMFSFAMFLANSDQETTRTIRFDPHPPYKVFTKFNQRLILFSISSAFNKLNQKQHNLTHVILILRILSKHS